jgi:hypothetical protein
MNTVTVVCPSDQPLVPVFFTSHGRGNAAWSYMCQVREELDTDAQMTVVYDEMLESRRKAAEKH